LTEGWLARSNKVYGSACGQSGGALTHPLAGKDVGQQEGQQVVELDQVVLEGGAGEHEAAARGLRVFGVCVWRVSLACVFGVCVWRACCSVVWVQEDMT
jgi:hypothetical protein